jgi:hypothetical protein
VTDACHRLGLQFILWYEPERVAGGSKIAGEHPEFVFSSGKGRRVTETGGLFKLSDPVARRWLTDHLSHQIGEFGLDVYRNDFNIDPLGFWHLADAPDRQGMTEIRYVEGLYAMWDELRTDHPGLWIDNCSSGGRRIDLETCMRSVPCGEATPVVAPPCRLGSGANPRPEPLYSAVHRMHLDARCLRRAQRRFGRGHLPVRLPGTRLPARTSQGGPGRGARESEILVWRFLSAHRSLDQRRRLGCMAIPSPDLNAGIVLAFRRAKSD